MADITTRLADATIDLDSLVGLARDSACEQGMSEIFDEAHTRAHLTELLTKGIGFVACIDEVVIGTILLTPIETGFAILRHVESAHLMMDPRKRTMPAVRALIRTVRKYCTEHDIVALIHMVGYGAAIAGRKDDARRVDALYKMLIGDGTYGITYVIRPDSKK